MLQYIPNSCSLSNSSLLSIAVIAQLWGQMELGIYFQTQILLNSKMIVLRSLTVIEVMPVLVCGDIYITVCSP